MGVHKGARRLKDAPPVRDKGPKREEQPCSEAAATVEDALGGEEITGDLGTYYVITRTYPPEHPHGSAALEDWLGQRLRSAAVYAGDERIGALSPRDFVFMDTETTGLGGAGTLVFMIGVGAFTEAGDFEIRQYFLRDPAEEAAMLAGLAEYLADFGAWATFNGRTFDVPLLASRYFMNRMRTNIEDWPNLDLLQAARRLYRRLPSRRLGALETDVLGIRRTGEDIPGALIPALYAEYLQTGNAREMGRVAYHNLIDILSMVTLGACINAAFTDPYGPHVHAGDRVSIARWVEALSIDEAEALYAYALDGEPDEDALTEALEGLAAILKSQGRYEEAAPLWEQLAALHPRDAAPRIELAKCYEWRTPDLKRAQEWAADAYAAASLRHPSARRAREIADIEHRLRRLARKIEAAGSE